VIPPIPLPWANLESAVKKRADNMKRFLKEA